MSTSPTGAPRVCGRCGKVIQSLSRAKSHNGVLLCEECAATKKEAAPKREEYTPSEAEKKIFYDTLSSIFDGAKIPDSIYWDAERLTKDGKYRYFGIAKTLEYVARVKGMSIDLSYGLLGVIPRFYNEAAAYWAEQKAVYDANIAFKPDNRVNTIVISEPTSKEIFKPKTNIEEL